MRDGDRQGDAIPWHPPVRNSQGELRQVLRMGARTRLGCARSRRHGGGRKDSVLGRRFQASNETEGICSWVGTYTNKPDVLGVCLFTIASIFFLSLVTITSISSKRL